MKTIEDYKSFIDQVRKETGLEAITSDESGLVTVNVDERFNLNLQFVEATGKILCLVEVTELPKDAPKEVYRDLLIGGLFGKDTAGGYFALENETEAVVYNYFFDLEEASKEVDEFVSSIEKILQLCEIWADRIMNMLTGNEATIQDEPRESSHLVFHP